MYRMCTVDSLTKQTGNRHADRRDRIGRFQQEPVRSDGVDLVEVRLRLWQTTGVSCEMLDYLPGR